MKKYEAVIILNPNLSSKVDEFKKDFDKLLIDNSFKILKTEDVGRRQLAYSIANHNKGHYILFNLEGDPSKLLEIETKIKYNESIIRHLFLVVKVHNGEDSSLLIESKNKKTPILALTAAALKKEQKRMFEVGANDFLTKPIVRNSIEKTLKQFLNIEQSNKATIEQIQAENIHIDFHNFKYIYCRICFFSNYRISFKQK